MDQLVVQPLNSEIYQLNPKFGSIEDFLYEFHRCEGKIDLGCGYNKPKNYVGFDNGIGFEAQLKTENAPDIYMDLNSESLPLKENSCSEVRNSHFLEHSRVDHIVKESYRVLKPGGKFVITVPYANSAEGMYPGHNIFFTEKWFRLNLVFQKHFEIVDFSFRPSDYWEKLPIVFRLLVPFKFARIFLFNACSEMTLTCLSRKQN